MNSIGCIESCILDEISFNDFYVNNNIKNEERMSKEELDEFEKEYSQYLDELEENFEEQPQELYCSEIIEDIESYDFDYLTYQKAQNSLVVSIYTGNSKLYDLLYTIIDDKDKRELKMLIEFLNSKA